MIVKGRSRTDGGALANYLLSEGHYEKNREDNERVEIWEAVGVAEGLKLQTLLQSFEFSAATTHCAKPLYHMQLRSADGEHLTREQWQHSVEKAEARLGLAGRDRVIVAHTKEGQVHVHVVWNRIDSARGKAVDMSHDALKRLDVARELENELGLRKLGMERGGKLSAKEEAFAQRHGKDPQQIKDILQTCWEHANTGHEFTAHLDAYGMVLVKGDKRGFLAVDREGDFYAVNRVTGAREKEVRAKLADLDRDQLPSLHQVRDQMKERQSAGLLRHQATDRNRLEMKQWRDLQRLEDQLTQKAGMRDRFQQMQQDDRDVRKQRRLSRLGATLYDSADMVSMQQDAMRDVRARFAAREQDAMRDVRARFAAREQAARQAQGQQRRMAGQAKYEETAYQRVTTRHTQQSAQLAVRQYVDRKRAGVADPERDRHAEQMLLPQQFDKAAAQTTGRQEETAAERAAHVRAALRAAHLAPQEPQQLDPERVERTARVRRALREGGQALTERDRPQHMGEGAGHQHGIPRTEGGRERERER